MSILGGGGSGPATQDPGLGKSNVEPLPVFLLKYGFTLGAEPTWPTTEGATVVDANGNTWTAIKAREAYGAATAVYDASIFEDTDRPEDATHFQYGVLTWLTGFNTGVRVEVSDFFKGPAPVFHMAEGMPNPIVVGDTYRVTVGCARTIGACKTFDNFRNYRGYNDMPTEDRALESPNYTQQGVQDEDSAS